MSQALYRKWRPTTWDGVVGQDHIIQTLKNAVITNHVGHAYLFAGPRGTGKTSSARLLAKAVNCVEEDLSLRPCNTCANCASINLGNFLDLIEIDAASNTSVEDVRDLREKINFSPSQGKYKVYIIDEVHMLSTSAFNALLKTLEEPPPHVIFILATTEIHKIPATVLSRCQRHEFRVIPVQTILEKLKIVCESEKIEIEEEALSLIARQSTGSLRDAISMLDQLASMTQKISIGLAQDILGTATNQSVISLVDAILDIDESKGLTTIHKALDSGSDPRQFARQIVDYLRNLLLIKMGLSKQVQTTKDTKTIMEKQAKVFLKEILLTAIKAFSASATDLKANWHPGLGLEMAFAEVILQPKTEVETHEHPQVSQKAEKVIPENPLKNEQKIAEKKETENKKPEKKETDPEKDTPEIEKTTNTAAQAVYKTPEEISEQWKGVREIVRKINPLTEGLINSARLMGIQNNTVILNFPSELLKGRMTKASNLDIMHKALVQVFGTALKIRCITGAQNTKNANNDFSYDANGMVGLVTRDLGGEIVDVQ